MKKSINFLAIFIVFAIILSIFLPSISALAVSQTNKISVTFRDGYTSAQGKVQYSLDDGANWVDVTSKVEDRAIATTGNNLKLKIIPNDGYSVDFTGISLYLDGTKYELNDNTNGIAGGITSNNGYLVNDNVKVVSLKDVEFRKEDGVPGGNDNGPHVIEGGTKVTGHFTYNNTGDGDPADIWLNETEIGVGEPPAESKDYYYVEGSGVTFKFGTLINSRITSIKINDYDYSDQLPKTKDAWLEANHNQFDIVEITNVPFADTYKIQTTTTRDFEWSVGNFLWSYMDKDKGTDDYIGNGKLDFVSLEFKGKKYNGLDELKAANKDYLYFDGDENEGGAVLPAGGKLTVRLVPNSGYQLTSFTCNGQVFTTQDQVGYFTFDVPSGNFHWGASFTKVNNLVKTNTSSVESGTIRLGGNEASMAIGTARLDVGDTNVSNDEKNKFEKAAGDYQISNYLDISLYNTVYKGSSKSSWDTEVTDLNNNANISLKINNSSNDDIVLVHEKHDGTYEVIDVDYNSSNSTVNFATKSFSKYAIAKKKKTVPFKDVNKKDWYYEAVLYAYSNNLIKGYNDTTFAPNDNLTRGMLVTILYRLDGAKRNDGKSKFTDVNSKEWYAEPIKWAAENGVVAGYNNTTFGPNDNITREQLAVILYRYAGYKNKDMSKTNDLKKFSDTGSISDYAVKAMKWAVGTGVITGNANGTLNPKGNATRAEVAAMMTKYCMKVGK